MRDTWIALFAVLGSRQYASAQTTSCPNLCSGHGLCTDALLCDCEEEGVILNPDGNSDELQPGWTGADCSLKRCPRGFSWISPGFDDTSSTEYCTHDLGAECSDKGLCDRTNGQCDCLDGYSGAACQRLECPNKCSGHGICQSSVKFAQDATISMNTDEFAAEGLNGQYGFQISYNNAWDSEMSFGCKCDTGYRGPDCSMVECPTGPDILDDFCVEGVVEAWIEFVGTEYYDTAVEGTLSPNERPLINQLLLYNTLYAAPGHECTLTSNGEYSLTTTEIGVNCVSGQFCNGANSGMPCAGQGICDYSDGTCSCFDGFTGSACNELADLQ